MLVVHIAKVIERQVAMRIIIVDVRLVGVPRGQHGFFEQLVASVRYAQLHLSFVVKDEIPLRVADGLKRNSSTDYIVMGVEQRPWV